MGDTRVDRDYIEDHIARSHSHERGAGGQVGP